MARQKTVTLTGKAANLIFYEFRGIPCVRTHPDRVRQTKATKQSARQFGKAARLSAMLRAALSTALPDSRDKPMTYRLNNALRQWLQAQSRNGGHDTGLPFLQGFEFNEESLLYGRLKKIIPVQWKKGGSIVLDLSELVPQRDLVAPAYTERVHWHVAVASIPVAGSTTAAPRMSAATLTMEYNDLAYNGKPLSLSLERKTGELTVAVIGLRYEAVRKGMRQLVTEQRWQPAAIVGAFAG